MKVALLCGGPSLERGISLNSARSVLDHLEGEGRLWRTSRLAGALTERTPQAGIEIIPIYFDYKKKAYRISKAQLYSNTPSDFDFKLASAATALNPKNLIKILQAADIVFPVIHGAFGEDGELQNFLEKNNIPFVGSGAEACQLASDKYKANNFIRELGFYTLPSTILGENHRQNSLVIRKFFKDHHVARAVVKPAKGGSSIGVFSVKTEGEALEKTEFIIKEKMDTRVVLEPFAAGKEFTVIILENFENKPIAILPTEIETDYTENQIFDFRRKYLPTRHVTYHCPPRFGDRVIAEIQAQAEEIFSLLGMRDFGRFDGWVLDNGKIWFSDFNPISGMEQNSFLFQQASRVGFSHRNVLRYILKHACSRYEIPFPESSRGKQSEKRKPVNVLFGGATSERQVSLMSGTNVWLKLRRSGKYEPEPYLLDSKNNAWHLPYALTLNHTVEEIAENCRNASRDEKRLKRFELKVRKRLGLSAAANEPFFIPKKISLRKFIGGSKFIFIGLHGGIGEDGTLQKKMEEAGIKYNGSNSRVSRLCMDKAATAKFIKELDLDGIAAAPQKLARTKDLFSMEEKEMIFFWENLQAELGSETLIVKPRADGCSSGIVRLYDADDLGKYLVFLKSRSTHVPKGTFRHQPSIIEMPVSAPESLIFEKFIETDNVWVENNKFRHEKKTGWIEITVGILEKGKTLQIFNPSITVAEGEVLSVEEKFQGGTGVNITPPPSRIISSRVLRRIKANIKLLASKIGIKGYGRIDAFMNINSGDIIVIEVNTLPGLTPSTVLYHQALAEKPPIFPRQLIEKIIENKKY